MRNDIRLTTEDIKIKQENALDSFFSGIKSKGTKEPMTRNLKKFLVDACADLLEGDFEQRAQRFVDLSRTNQEKATHIILAYIKRLKTRTTLDKSDPLYLNPSTIPNKIKPIKKLVEMNGLGLPWKRVYSTYPELNNTHQGRGYSREEIQKLLEYSDGLSTDFILLASSSGGLRVGAWENQSWGNIFPIYKVGDEYKVELEKNETGKIVCAGMFVYKGTPDQYVALISIEAWNKLQEYKKIWTKKMKRAPIDSDPLILERFSKPIPLNATTVKRRIEHLLQKSGLRTPLTEGKRRHQVPETHGFRRYWDKVMMTTQRKRGTLSALVIKERLMGHEGLVKTDKNYFWTDVLELVPDYLEAMPELMISEEVRLQKKLEDEKLRSERLEKTNHEKEELQKSMQELEAKVKRILKYHKDLV
ncbi:MAG: integrase [Nitrosopumilaceae archaeon]